MTTKTLRHEQRPFDLAAAPLTDPEQPTLAEGRPCAHQHDGIEELVELVTGLKPADRWRRERAVRDLLTHLAALPGQGWAQRWESFEASLTAGQPWVHAVLPDSPRSRRHPVVGAALGLMIVDVIRPSYRWMRRSTIRFGDIGARRDPADSATLHAVLLRLENQPTPAAFSLRLASQVQAHTGKHLRQVTAQDLIDFTHQVTGAQAGRSGIGSLWRAMHQLGWITHPSTQVPPLRRTGQMSCEQLVAQYGVDGPVGQLLTEYLKHRTVGLDYTSRKSVAIRLIKHYWCDMVAHHPQLVDFTVTPAQAQAWRQRIRFKPDGTPRADHWAILYTVRGFYLDLAQWSLHDSYWAPWVAPCPISSAELRGAAKARQVQLASRHQLTRELATLLPQLVDQAETDRRTTATALAAAKAAGPGGTISYDGTTWTVRQVTPTSPIRLHRHDRTINLTAAADGAFWAWAVIETLRHTGIRNEELLELTHLAIQPYTIPATGETIPLVHIVPSKTDQERLIVAGPELVHVLAQVFARLRDGQPTIPLTQRWDAYEKVLGPPLPHQFLTRRGRHHEVMSAPTVARHIRLVAEQVHIAATGQPARFTPHDLRRIFATDALSSGLPPHIVQVLMGHKSIVTTQGYAAVYPQDVIRHHRTFIAQRRRFRPTEEYRQPTPAEWEEFEAHFVSRKVSLGSCGRAYGTSCHHEHACLRCALLRPDPTQLDRLLEITANLKDRITEATGQGWVGEVEGLQISLTAAQQKLGQMQQQLAHKDEPVILGMPRRPDRTDSRR